MSEIKKVDEAIIVIEYHIKRKISAIKEVERKTELSENEKIKIGKEYEFIRNIKTLIKQFKDSMNAHLGKLPPQATDMEEVILGALLLEREAIDTVITFLSPDHFYGESHKQVYLAILELKKNNIPIDMRSAVIQLRKMGLIELVGGPAFIAELTAKVSSSANIEYHSRIVVEFAIKRQMIDMSSKIITDAYEDTIDCFELLEFSEKQINEAKAWAKK